MSDKKIMKSGFAVITVAAMLLISFCIVFKITTEAYAASSKGMITVGAEVLKDGTNTKDAQLVHMGDRYWYVIGYDGQGAAAGNDEITLLSEESIKHVPFDKKYRETYSDSDLKTEIETYLSEKFSADEKAAVIPRELPGSTDHEKDLKWWWNNYQNVDEVWGGALQKVLLWPLSAKEAVAVNWEIRKTGTDYWLRSLGMPGHVEYYWDEWMHEDFDWVQPEMAIVDGDGSVIIQEENTSYWKGMRPAFKLKKSDVVLTTAPSSKMSGDDGKLTPIQESSYADNKWKLTLRDESHASFHVDPCEVEFGGSGSLTVKYNGAKTGDNEYISAIIKGADGSVKQYGRITKVTEASGTVTIKGLPTDSSGKASLPEGDKLYVFNEQYNGEGKTDFASNLTAISFTGHDWVFDDIKYDTRTGAIEASYHCSLDGNHFKTIEKGKYDTERTDPTCEEPGKEYQVLSISADESLDGKAHKKSKYITDYAPKLGHLYNRFFGFRWTGDATSGYKKAEAIFACDHDYSHKIYVEAVVTEKVEEPTCTAIGRTLYQATLSEDKSPNGKEYWDAKYAKATKKLGHDWGEATYEWSADNSTVTATHVCKRDPSHVETETVNTEITKTTKKPTCKETGVGDFKTKEFWDPAFQEQTKKDGTIPVDPEAHDWDDGEEVIRPDVCGGKAMLFTCNICGEEEFKATDGTAHQWSEDYRVIVKPTCTEKGDSFRVCETCGIFDLEDPKPLDPTGHKWKFVDFTWTGDETDGYEKAVANYVCEHDASHKMAVDAEITSKVTEPTCEAGGKTAYTASVSAADSPDETAHSESKDAEATEKVSHEWKYSGMEWTGNETDGYTKALAKYTCEYGCGNIEKVEAKLTEEETEAGCENEGKTSYTATVDAENSITGEKHTDTKDAKVTEALGHDWSFKDMVWTGDEEKGYTKAEAKYVCENDSGHVKLVGAKITEKVIEPTCLEEGMTRYIAEVGSKDSPDGEEHSGSNAAKHEEATGHDWQLKDFTWTATGDKYGFIARANYVCKHDGSHTGSIGASMSKEEKDATCEEPGGTLYTATVTAENSLTDAEVKDEKLVKTEEPKGHDWSEWKVTKKATVIAKGTKVRTCSVCGKKETKSIAKLKTTGALLAKVTAYGKKALKIKWTKVTNVAGYDIFMSRCKYKGKTYKFKKIKTVKGNKKFSLTKKKLKKKTAYRVRVKAFVRKNGKKIYVKTSPVSYAFTGGYKGKYTNAKKVKVNRTAISLKAGKTYKLRGSVVKLKRNKKLPTGYAQNLRYLSANKKAATVAGNGKIKAVSKGTCKIYVYAQNGVYRTVKVTVR